MALVVEDGTGVDGADSFVTAADAGVREAALFGASTITNDAAGEAALRRAWVYMSALDWAAETYPTFGGSIPQEVIDAQAVLARSEVATLGFLSPSEALSGQKVLNRVGDIGWEVRATPATIEALRPVVTMAMDLLKPHLSGTGGVKTLLRA